MIGPTPVLLRPMFAGALEVFCGRCVMRHPSFGVLEQECKNCQGTGIAVVPWTEIGTTLTWTEGNG